MKRADHDEGSICPRRSGGSLVPNSYFYTERSNRKLKPFSSLSSREQKRQVTGYLRANPGASESQARRNLAAARRQGRIVRTGSNPDTKQISLSDLFRQRSERSRLAARNRRGVGGGIIRVRYKNDEQVYQDFYNKVMSGVPSRRAGNQTIQDRILSAHTVNEVIAAGSFTGSWNEQVVRWNIAHMTVQEKEWLLNATYWDILDVTSHAAKQGIPSVYFYHNDYYQAA
jgi:hypothetical protein